MAQIPKNYLDAVVSIGIKENDKYQSLATGFLVGFFLKKESETSNLYRVVLVTNRHVFEGKKQVFLRFNLNAGISKAYQVALEDQHGKKWLAHKNPNVDLAVLRINFNWLKNDEKASCAFIQEENFAYAETIKEKEILPGESVFALGFPLGLAGDAQNYVIVKGGVIARLDEEIIQRKCAFIIDSNIFPGNSGGPVILKTDMNHLKNTKPIEKAYLMGVISSYINYRDVAVSQQTQQVRVVFNENSGLAYVVPIDFVKEVAKEIIDASKEEVKPEKVELENADPKEVPPASPSC
ncbi:MAG TPA: hypothetical protein DIS66_00485 [Candidatus Omnitrophica bacterium]|nr:hypothetical protein [Candidatus Omnitrophota bacterium]